MMIRSVWCLPSAASECEPFGFHLNTFLLPSLCDWHPPWAIGTLTNASEFEGLVKECVFYKNAAMCHCSLT